MKESDRVVMSNVGLTRVVYSVLVLMVGLLRGNL